MITVDRPGHGRSADHRQAERVDAATPEEFRALYARLRQDNREVEQIEGLLLSLGYESVSTLGAVDGGLRAFQIAARGQVRVGAMVTIDTRLTDPAHDFSDEPAGETTVAGGADLDHLARLSEIMPTVLESKDPTPYVEWAMEYPQVAAASAEVQSHLQAMWTDNALPALLTTAAPGVDDLSEATLAAVTSRVLALYPEPRATRVRHDGSLDKVLPRAEVTIDSIPQDTPCYPMTSPEDCCRRVIAHIIT